MSSLPTAETLQAQMRSVRCEVGEDVQGIVDNARVLTDWHYYVSTYPWLCVGAAAALGYLVIPTRVHYVKPDPAALAELARQHKLVVQQTDSSKPKPGLMGAVVGMAVSALLQGGIGLAKQGLSSYLDGQLKGNRWGTQHNGSHNYEESGR
jgi:hypothetical protein